VFVIEKEFINNWKLFVNYNEFKSIEQGSYYAKLNPKIQSKQNIYPYPGQINNNKLLQDLSDSYNNENRENEIILKKDTDKIMILNEELWEFFERRYRGGPKILRKVSLVKTNFNNKIEIDLFHQKVKKP
jgi:hypothetical protein